ncbi:MAG: tyrosine--tRNA ligase [Candidatus Omnitrophica bacterium]|nr:tyrosine--tRNA ligase [Candidatus Omnitrophota bacterium]
MDIQRQIELISCGSAELLSAGELEEKLKRADHARKPLRIKFGADPTHPDLHLGHTVVLRKLRTFQELGHHVVFIIGGFTARIGDPSGESQTRPQITRTEVDRCARTYQEQVFKYLDRKKTEVVDNSDWLDELKLEEVIRIAAGYTVARLVERNDFEKRLKAKQPIGVHEFLYPLIQGYDSVRVRADVEIGGTDQKFNLLVGRELQRQAGQEPQIVLTMPLLVGTDGHDKMSKSLGNHIGIQEPPSSMYGKIMSLSDKLTGEYADILFPAARLFDSARPLETKKDLARRLTEECWGGQKALEAACEFEQVVQKKEIPGRVTEYAVPRDKVSDGKVDPVFLVTDSGGAASKSEARRLIEQGGVTLGGSRIKESKGLIDVENGQVLKVGKRFFRRLIVKVP